MHCDYFDTVITVPSFKTARIQECHILLGHILCGLIEQGMWKKLRAFILCGGKGSRLSNVSLGKPKSLVLVGRKPLIAHVIDHIVTFDIIEEIVFLTGYLGDQIDNFIINNFHIYLG